MERIYKRNKHGNTRMQLIRLLICLSVLFSSASAFGWSKSTTVYTTDGSYSDVAGAVADASSGDTVTIPSGTYNWGGAISTSSNITIAGAGGSLGGTRIRWSSGVVLYMSGNGAWRITGIYFDPSAETPQEYLQVKGAGGWQIDNCYFNNDYPISATDNGIYIRFNSTDDQPVGVIYDNTFIDSRIYVQGATYKPWIKHFYGANLLGSANTVFIEDNLIEKEGEGNVGNSYMEKYLNQIKISFL